MEQMEQAAGSSRQNGCVICDHLPNWDKKDDGEFIIVKRRGITTMSRISKNDRHDGFHHILDGQIFIQVHKVCWPLYINRSNVAASRRKHEDKDKQFVSPKKPKLRKSTEIEQTSTSIFDWKQKCFICENKIHFNKRSSFSVVNSPSIKDNLLKTLCSSPGASKRFQTLYSNTGLNENCRSQLIHRITSVDDLCSVAARYHRHCYRDIHILTRQPETEVKESLQEKIKKAMEKIYNYMTDHEDSQFTLPELIDVIKNSGDHVPCDSVITDNLEAHFQNDVVITRKGTVRALICLKSKAYDVLNDKYKNTFNDADQQDLNLIKKAAIAILKDVRAVAYEDLFYPASDTILHEIKESAPKKLQYFLNVLILNDPRKKTKTSKNYETICLSIAHAIISAARPRFFVSQLQLTLAVTFHRKFGSRQLIDMCHAVGFCASYQEVRRYEISAALQGKLYIFPSTFVQFVHDNADWNLDTLDGKNVFHFLGCIIIITPISGLKKRDRIPRLEEIPDEKSIANHGKISIKTYEKPALDGMKTITVKEPSKDLNLKFSKATKLNCYWILQNYINPGNTKGWNGYVEDLTVNNKNYEVSIIQFLPFIYAPPTDYNTLYTAILQSVYKAHEVEMKTCIITFDQPLYYRARDIVSTTNFPHDINVVIRLGGFHTLMSFLGSIGFIMRGSGLKDVLNNVYGENTSENILSGHQYARAIRAIRAHTLVQLALIKIILSQMEEVKPRFKELVRYLKQNSLLEPKTVDELLKSDVLKEFIEDLEDTIDKIEDKNPTCKLWIRYCKMVFIVKDFIYAEKSGSWDLHLETIERMIPFFHASGHFAYAKSAQMYLQDMKALEQKMTIEEYYSFTKLGYWTSRRTDKYFSGIFTDQTIEQTLMKMLKFEGGLFKRGVTESIAHLWIQGFIFTKDIIEVIETLTGVSFDKNYQHKDSSDSRIQQDAKSLKKLEQYLEQYCPFPDVDAIINIANGINGNKNVNCHQAFEVGINIMTDIKGKNYQELKLSRKNIVINLASKGCTTIIGDKKVQIDPNLLFQRICVMKKSIEEMKVYLRYELSLYPQSIFDEFGLRKTEKSKLYAIFSKTEINVKDSSSTYCIIDGGLLIHKIKWYLDNKFSDILDNYVSYILNHYGTNTTVVFDGYEKMTTKGSERNRRALHATSAEVRFNETMLLKISQDKFLGNIRNKTRLIQMLACKLEDKGIRCVKCEGDADRTIVTTAIEIAKVTEKKVVIVCEDTDVLVIMTALTPDNLNVYFNKPPSGKNIEATYSTNSLAHKPSFFKENILTIHAFSGCDTTSAFYRKTKLNFCKTLENNEDLAEHLQIFKEKHQTVDTLLHHSIQLLLAMYDAKKGFRKPNVLEDQLLGSKDLTQTYCYRLYLIAIRKQTLVGVNLATLMPTFDAFSQHVKRVYLQVQSWLYGEYLDPTEWGWKIVDNCLVPIQMTNPPGPPEIMSMIFCSCTKNCGKSCGCRRNGLSCTLACRVCCGNYCSNPINVQYNGSEEGDTCDNDTGVNNNVDNDQDNEDDDEHDDGDDD